MELEEGVCSSQSKWKEMSQPGEGRLEKWQCCHRQGPPSIYTLHVYRLTIRKTPRPLPAALAHQQCKGRALPVA